MASMDDRGAARRSAGGRPKLSVVVLAASSGDGAPEARGATLAPPEPVLAQLEAMLAGTTHDELLDLWEWVIEEASRRAEAYARVAQAGADVDLVNEGIAFAVRVTKLNPFGGGGSERVDRAWYRSHKAEEALLAARSKRPRLVGASAPGTTRELPAIEAVAVRVEPGARLVLTDEAVLGAVAEAERQWHEYRVGRGSWARVDGVSAGDVADVLAGNRAYGDQPANTPRRKVAHGDIVGVGKVLNRLNRDGRLLRASKPYDRNRNRWTSADTAGELS